jgi:CARDB/Leishmanolysin/Bacterial pre-peptidase C-terminal domain/Bacterial Ig-like domain
MRHPRYLAIPGALAGMLAATTLWSCGGSDGSTGPPTPTPTTLSLSLTSVTLAYVGATTTVTAKIRDQNGSPLTGAVTWVSDAPAVATVTTGGGVITAVGNGTTTVRASTGNLTASVAVTVQQAVTGLELVSGDAQSALAGEPLSEKVVVRAMDQGGTSVEGVTVAFTPDAGSGTVDPATDVTGSDGKASTTWTMGEAFGPQKLTATAASASRIFTAKSLSAVRLPDLVTDGTLSVQRPDPSTLDTVVVGTTITNAGDTASGAFRVRLLSDDVEIATQDVASLEPAAHRTVSFTLDPFAAGTHALRLEVDPDSTVKELIESNNVLTKSVPVVLETLLQGVTTLTGLAAATNVELRYRLDLPAPADNLTVELGGGSGDVDLFIKRGQRPSTRDDYNDCQSGGPTTTERCQLTGIEAGSYHILLHAYSAFSGTTMTITLDGEVLPYNIEVVFIDHGTPRQDSAVTAAAERWMTLLPVDVPDLDFSGNPLPANTCLDGQPAVTDVVDDIRIFVSIKEIDGPGNVLAQATPCIVRGLGDLPIIGFMQFDSTDLTILDASDQLFPVVLHEMAHVLGLGTIWSDRGFLQNPSLPSSAGVDTYFSGQNAIAAFDAAGGTGYSQGQKVPVENKATEGSSDGHWRESVLGRELMTPYFNNGVPNPLSAITVKSMEDLGYQVDATKADAFGVSFSAPARIPGGAQHVVDLSGDVARRSLILVDAKGRVREIRR